MSLRPTYRHPDAREYRAPGGPWDQPSLDALLTNASANVPDVLLCDDTSDVELDGAALEERVAALAGGLRAQGVRRGDVVAWQAPGWHESVLLYRACWRLGAVAAPLHHQAGDAEVEDMVDVLAPTVWITTDDLRARVAALSVSAAPVRRSAARPADLAVVLFTSGSTGAPKAVLHTHRGLAYKARSQLVMHGIGAEDATLMPLPMGHMSGLLNGALVPGVAPMHLRVMERWEPDRALDFIERDRVTFMVGPTALFVSLIDAPGFTSERVDSLRLVASGFAGVSPAFIDDTSARLGARIKRSYGSTEAPTVSTTRAGDPVERGRDTDGRSTGWARLRITDPATGRELPPGAIGELWLRGPELFVGYVDPNETRASITRGWFRTGDLGTLDEEGWLTIVGRIKELIIRGGENIATSEVETVLEAHPAVRQAVAVGMPDQRLGERVCAFVVATERFDLEECRRWFEHRGIAKYKTPERVIQLDALPLLPSAKADRAALRELAATT